MTPTVRIYSYSACTTCKRALKWLSDNNIDYDLLDIIQTPPIEGMLVKAAQQLGGRKKLFNTSGLSYRKLGAKLVQEMSDAEAMQALVSDGKLIKRPFLVTQEGQFLVGFKPEIWSDVLLG